MAIGSRRCVNSRVQVSILLRSPRVGKYDREMGGMIGEWTIESSICIIVINMTKFRRVLFSFSYSFIKNYTFNKIYANYNMHILE